MKPKMEEGSEKTTLVFAYYVTGHGYGHATRVVEVVRNLIQAGHEVHVVTGAPEYVFTSEIESPRLFIRKVLLDCGAVQTDALTVDRLASLEKYVQTAVVPRASILATEAEWLKSVKADLVVSDVVPVACRAAADAEIRSICVTNFSWDFIYAEYIMEAGHHSRSIVWQIAEDYSHSEFLIRLPGYCPMPAFRDSVDVPLVVRRVHKGRTEVRKELGIGEDTKVLIYNFGGQPAGWKLEKDYLPDGWICLVCGASEGQVVARILQDTAFGKDHAPCKLSGSRRLRDAIVLGYQLQRVSGKDIAVPEWYTLAQNELGFHSSLPDDNNIRRSLSLEETEDFEILHGDHRGLSDTIGFLKSLAELHALGNQGSVDKHMSRESQAAAAMFNWEEEIIVSRAPGRLDVMGGIADYSGSLVLQMPIREACHVAIQRNQPGKQKLWKHAQARKHDKGQVSSSVLQIVSFGSELGNRAPTFDMDLSDLMDGGKPISYEKARQFFSQDPSQKWAAYVAGTILVLMTELGVQIVDGISILVFSGVPEGKGVSSSAAIEVATMSAMAASLGLDIAPRDLALLCQKACSFHISVENHIVGAPCGIMDQMASACGEEDKLLAMLCQPAEVLGHVEIPPHIRFWGIDSGIRHSVGGADYGSVRIGAFMGRKIIKSMATESLHSSALNGKVSRQVETMNIDEMIGHNVDLHEAEAELDYLCNLPPHRYEESYVHRLPEFLLGNDFVEKYLHHDDTVTVIDKAHSYAVRAPTRHPIYENFRVKAFKALLSSAPSDDQLTALGELMYQCHYSYSSCGLGSDGTDRLVELVQEMQHSKSSNSCGGGTLYGAKITGGGSGGTIQQKYRAATGFLPFLFEGSSPGAGKFGYLKIRFRSRPATSE
ncbi:L-arabinokinase-like [Dorcoceras hygrometricum]|uniref:L-arabinokinase-like n=1 Tax=Dorcoceras hygrometricum TaxID=472368 RepID=A0A2Z7CSV0_9LAMI|nr:L-arabinokinase-like [Dorcoceras hygrometricum]